MAKTRQRAREERERLAALAAAERERSGVREAARRGRRARLTGWVPKAQRPVGVLAAKRAAQLRMTVAILIAANVVVYLVTRDLRTVALTLVVSVLVAPVVFTMLHRRR